MPNVSFTVLNYVRMIGQFFPTIYSSHEDENVCLYINGDLPLKLNILKNVQEFLLYDGLTYTIGKELYSRKGQTMFVSMSSICLKSKQRSYFS